MIELDLRADVAQARAFYRNLKERGIKRAAARAINDVLITLRAEGARQIKADHPALKIGTIKENITTYRATPNRLTGSLETKGRPLSITLFALRGGSSTRRIVGPRGQISLLRVNRALMARLGRGAASVVAYQGRKAFRVLSYGNEVFVRRFAKGRQLRRFRGPSLPGVFRAQRSFFLRRAEERWAVTFKSRIAYEIELAKR